MRFIKFSRAQVFGAILFFGLLAMTARTATDPDLWWHLRTGQWIVQNGSVPHVDSFSFTRAGHAWVSHEWLSEVLFYEFWKVGGAAALIIFAALITTSGFLLLYLRCPGKGHWAAAATVIGTLASAASWGVRPQMFTFALASLLLWLIEAGENRPKLLIWIPPMFLLWLNLHAGFALGPVLLIAYGFGLILEVSIGETPWHEARPILVRMSTLLVICLALVPLNPSGFQLYRYPLDTLRSPAMRSIIVEWFSPDFHQSLYKPLLVVWLLLLVALGVSRSRPRGRVILPLLMTALAALDAVRHIPIFVLMAMPVIASVIPEQATSYRGSRLTVEAMCFRSLFTVCVIVLLAGLVGVKWATVIRSQRGREAELFPVNAIRFLKTTGQPYRLFVYYDWGGYAVWNLYPEYQVFVDGRADLYGDDLLRQFKDAMQVREGWKDILDQWSVDSVLIPTSSALSQALILDPTWKQVFSDRRAIVLIRNRPAPKRVGNLKSGRLEGQQSEKNVPRGL